MTDTPKVTFEDLAALQQKSRTPCGKQAFSLPNARSAAKIRNRYRHLGNGWYVHPCYRGCGRDIFHLTTTPPYTEKNIRLNKGVRPTKMVPGKRTRKNRRWAKNAEAYRVLSLGTWEDDGGALHPREMED